METTETFDIMKMADRVTARGQRRRTAGIVAGVGLAALSLGREGVTRPLLLIGGLALVLRSATGRSFTSLVQELPAQLKSLPEKLGLKDSSERRFAGGRHDLVDEASWESFPASDAPSYSPRAT